MIIGMIITYAFMPCIVVGALVVFALRQGGCLKTPDEFGNYDEE